MFSVDVKVGRLLEIRIVGNSTPQDVDYVHGRLLDIFRSRPGKMMVACDLTRTGVFSPEVASKVGEIFRQDNPRVERSGILVADSAIFSLQIERLVLQAANPARRCFHDAFDMKTYLGGLLVHEEHIRLAQFLAERDF